MTRVSIIVGIVLVLAGAAAFFLWPGSAPEAPLLEQQGTLPNTSVVTAPEGPAASPAEQAVRETFQKEVAGHPDNLRPLQTVVVGEYALQGWAGDVMGGETLYKYDSAQGAWIMIEFGGGAWSVEGLMSMGVPQQVAVALVAGVGR